MYSGVDRDYFYTSFRNRNQMDTPVMPMRSESMMIQPESVTVRSESLTIQPESFFINVDGVQKELFAMELQRCFITEKGVEMQIVKVSNVVSFKCICLQCGRNFFTRDLLQLHMETHLQSEEKDSQPSTSSFNGKSMSSTVADSIMYTEDKSKLLADLDQDVESKIGILGTVASLVDFTRGADDDKDDDVHEDDRTVTNDNEEGFSGNLRTNFEHGQQRAVEDRSIEVNFAHTGDGINSSQTYDRDVCVANMEGKLSDRGYSGWSDQDVNQTPQENDAFKTQGKEDVDISAGTSTASDSRKMSLEQMNKLIVEQQRLLETESDAVTLECKICGKNVTGGRHKFIDHVNRHAGKKPYVCPICNQGFATKPQLDGHSQKHGGRGRDRHRGEPHVCKACGKQFKRAALLKAHIVIHEEKLYACSVCDKRFHWKWTLTDHMRTHTGAKPHLCPTCGKGFSSRYNMRCHVLLHTGEKPYKCVTCEKTFATSSKLKNHTRVHTGEKAHLCTVCGKTFSASRNLKNHMAMHRNETFKCTICDKVFQYDNSLRQHMEINHGNNSETCEVCGKVFRHHRYLMSHLRLHKKLYTCIECDKIFSSNQNLQNHLKKHSNEKVFQCAYCGLVASSQKQLSKHMKEHDEDLRHGKTAQYGEATQHGEAIQQREPMQHEQSTHQREAMHHGEITQYGDTMQHGEPKPHQETYHTQVTTNSVAMPSTYNPRSSSDMNWNVGSLIDELTCAPSEMG